MAWGSIGTTELLFIAILLLVPLLLLRWVYVDAKGRGLNAWLWTVVVLVFSLLGLVVYLGVRRSPAAPPPHNG